MKKVLLVVETIEERTNLTDVIESVALELKEQNQIIGVVVEEAKGGPVAEKLRVRGVNVYDFFHGGYVDMPKEVDFLIACDEWGINKCSMFKGKKKIRLSEGSDASQIIEMVLGEEFDGIEVEEAKEEVKPVVIAETKLCEACGAANSLESMFCARCGQQFGVPVGESSGPIVAPKPKAKTAAKGKGGKKK